MIVKNSTNNKQKLNQFQVNSIRQKYAEGDRQQDLADEFGVTQAVISNIVNYRSWQDPSKDLQTMLTNAQVRQIRNLKNKITELKERVKKLEEFKKLAEELIGVQTIEEKENE